MSSTHSDRRTCLSTGHPSTLQQSPVLTFDFLLLVHRILSKDLQQYIEHRAGCLILTVTASVFGFLRLHVGG